MYENSSPAQPVSVGRYTAKTFAWMFLGLAATFAVMVATYLSGLVTMFLSLPAMAILAILELITVFKLSASVGKLSTGAARAMFFLYAVLNGLTFSTLFLYFNAPSLVLAFGVTAVYFGVMAAVGYFTAVDLSRLRPLLTGGLVLMIVFNLLGMFFGFGGAERLLCFAGVALLPPMMCRKSKPCMRHTAIIPRFLRMLPFLRRFSCISILSTCSCISCACLATATNSVFRKAPDFGGFCFAPAFRRWSSNFS